MIMNLGKQTIGCFVALLLMCTNASAQPAAPAKDAAMPATATAAPAAAAATEAPAVAKTAPALPQGSTAGVGWNNPPKWSDVEQKPQYASVPGREMNVLVEDNGQAWRTLRNGPITFYGGILLLVAPTLLLLFFFIKGPFKLNDTPTGRLVERFNSAERMTHWTVAISFVLLAAENASP